MTTNNKISTLIETQFPEFFFEDGPVFVDFIKAYYEWLEQEKNVIDATQNVLNYRDIDNTLDEYVQYFISEFIPSVPEDAIGDKRLFIKYAIEFYRGKGSEASYKLLFRMLYDEDITIYYPREDILKVSDGRWVEESSIRLGRPFQGDLDSLEGQEIEGLTSGATATVDRVIRGQESGLLVREVFITNSDGAFRDGEVVTNNKTGDDLITGTVVSFVGTLVDIDPVRFKGQGHSVGDRFTVTGAGGSGANGTVIETSDTSAVSFSVVDGGSGYRKGEEVVNVYGSDGFGADFEIATIVNTEIIQLNTDIIEPVKDVVLGTEPYFVSDGANTAAVSNSFATANINSTLSSALEFDDVTVGSIGSVITLASGTNYDPLPSASVRDETIWRLRISDGEGGYKGKNANVVASYLPGAIEDIRIDESGGSYNKNKTVTLTNITVSNTVAARGLPVVTG
ncbi:hypothetical protein, partial [Methanohalobium sp.]|uniref:hypothetical protein n=1 Tax=Methanohalobium sp. TaxID=2837493 RepID=UPI0025EF83F2